MTLSSIVLHFVGEYEWASTVSVQTGAPPARTLHTANAIDDQKIFVFGGIHSSTPYKALNDAWILDLPTLTWIGVGRKVRLPEVQLTTPREQSGRSSKNPSSPRKSFASDITPTPRMTPASQTKSLQQKMNSLNRGAHHKSTVGIVGGPGRKGEKGSMLDSKENFHEQIIALVTSMANEDAFEGVVTYPDSPAPRSGHTCTLISSMQIILFGGSGGFGYSRRHLNDVHSFSVTDSKWTPVDCTGNPPSVRCGHGAVGMGMKIFIFGGWNHETQFNDLFMLDMTNKDWSDLDLSWSVPRWNLSMQLVRGLPNNKLFVFGGSVDEEGEGRSLGTFDNQIGVLDMGPNSMCWDEPVLDEPLPATRAVMQAGDSGVSGVKNMHKFVPCPREHAAVMYDETDSRLVLFGGWSHRWHDDVWSIDVSAIIGPPYAVYSVSPALGPVSGKTKIQISGEGFQSVTGRVQVRFRYGGQSVDVDGIVIDDRTIACDTPSVVASIGAQSCEVRVAIGTKDFTNTYCAFQFFLNTSAPCSLCYGPGLLEDGETGVETVFMVQARNSLGENRTSGGDIVKVTISADCTPTVTDVGTGNYLIKYRAPKEGPFEVRVEILNEVQVYVPVRGSPFHPSFVAKAKHRANQLTGPTVVAFIAKGLKELDDIYRKTDAELSRQLANGDVKGLIAVVNRINELYSKHEYIELRKDEIGELLSCLEKEGVNNEKAVKQLRKISELIHQCRDACKAKELEIAPILEIETGKYKALIHQFETGVLRTLQASVKADVFYHYKTGVTKALARLDEVQSTVIKLDQELSEFEFVAKSFGYAEILKGSTAVLRSVKDELSLVKALWDSVHEREAVCASYLAQRLVNVQADAMEEEIKGMVKKLRELKIDKKSDCFVGEMDSVRKWLLFVPLMAELKDPSMRDRHWASLLVVVKQPPQPVDAASITVGALWKMELFKFADGVGELGDQAKQEGKMEKFLARMTEIWGKTKFMFTPHKSVGSSMATAAEHSRPPVKVMKMVDEDFDLLEDHQVQVQNMFASRFFATFESEIVRWQKALANVSEVVGLLSEVQKSWSFLENLFIHSEEVKKELPEDTNRFVKIDEEVRQVLAVGETVGLCTHFCNQDGIAAQLDRCLNQLSVCEKSLNDFMDGKRRAFPRFYFVSTVDLLDILSNGNTPAKVMVHLSKVFQCVSTYTLEFADGPSARPRAIGMDSCVGTESVPFPTPLPLVGKVEIYMDSCIGAFRSALKHYAEESLRLYHVAGDAGRGDWIKSSVVAQCVLLTNMITWVRRVEESFVSLGGGDALALAAGRDRSASLLLDLIKLTQTELDKQTRQKVMCMITLDAHNRDIQEKLVQEKVVSADAFQWQAQLKAYWNVESKSAIIRIADATFDYGYEYLGNGARLVITPLTDRIYVTCTQALHLGMGCAPAGPAGTGKTESTKDLANALGKPCFVFNASPEMDYKTMGNIFKGLASSGSWGCFDEFNRLIPEVLSVCSVQFKAVCDAIKSRAQRFLIQGDEISVDYGCGVFITMNPGYIGRSNLPSSLSSLFRPVTVMVADFYLIISNCLMSEGFLDSDNLAKKFSTLYALCADLLSKSKQYDWGMRAIKSVLVVAGAFKRADPSLSEEAVLMRALRDTNIAKIDGDDLKIFMGLLNDLFPGVDVPRARNVDFETVLVETMAEMGYTNDPEGYLLLKITQLVELMGIRHCIFMMGPPGSFKSAVWRILAKAKEKIGEKTTWVDLNPKSISTQELYGYVNMATREWKDGILSKTMRTLAQAPDSMPKWIVLDGDLDANWIESMNSVMDDNKLLTLPSNERIPLKPNMRMIFEIRDLNFATPATVTRAGVVNLTDYQGVQWRSFKTSWILRLSLADSVKDQLTKLFDKFCPDILLYLKKQCKIQVPMVDISIVHSLCSLLEAVLTERVEKGPYGKDGSGLEKDVIEALFLFCLVWASGGCLGEVDGVDYRKQFSGWWRGEVKSTVKYPAKGSVFDYYVSDQGRFEEWSQIVPKIDYSSQVPMSSITVPTVETVSAAYIVKSLIRVHHPVMLIGMSGCGKTQQCKGILKELDQSVFTSVSINMNYYTDSASLQTMMEVPLEKKAGRLFAPPGKLHLIYYIDDLNMPALDPYNTQSAISLLRQGQDYKHWYDRQKITIKDIGNTQLLCAMNPSAGSFVVDQRLQRHFWTCSVPFPEQGSLLSIYSTFMKGHFDRLGFKPAVIETVGQVVKAGLALHTSICKGFRKTAQNFHYEFNIRHLSGVFGGLLQVKPNDVSDPEKAVMLWIHETERVYGDRLVSMADVKKFKALLADLCKKSFKFNLSKFFQDEKGGAAESIVFAPFAKGFDEPCYDRIGSIERLTELLGEALKEYNETNPVMDLVLFEDAVKHVAKITRIVSNPSGHALLVGVGGSGRQSLSRLAGFIVRASTMGIVISSTYSLNDLKNDLQTMYQKAGVKDEKVLFLFTDGQITNEKFLVYINDLLSCGEIADLYTNEEKDAVRNAVRSACKSEGIPDTPENLWNFFISRIKSNLHMSLCFSPVGDAMRSRARKFPALINCTVIDWFQPWPKEALKSVAVKFLTPIESLGPTDSPMRKGITEFIPFSFECVSQQSALFMQAEKRFAYTTPKSFLELIKLYTHVLGSRLDALEEKRTRLENGLEKLRQTQSQVADLELALKEKAVLVEEKARSADAFAQQVGLEKEIVNAEVDKAAIERAKCEEIAKNVTLQQKSCEADLAVAIPLVQKAEAALDVLNKKDFQELKSFAKPPPGVDKVCETCLYLLAGIDPNIECDKKGKVKETGWKGSQKMMSNPEKFLENLKGFKGLIDTGKVARSNIEAARPLTLEPDFTVESMTKKSKAAAGLCEWVLNIVMYFDVVESVEPKKLALREATATLNGANEKLAKVEALVAELQARLSKLIAEFDAAMAEKDAVLAEAERCKNKLDLAQRLIGALGANGGIWEATIASIGTELQVLPGNVVVACSFVSYLSVFSRQYRQNCLAEFVSFLTARGVPLTPHLDPLSVLTSEAELARWQTQGLPSDRVSCENGAVIANSQRWCLLLDPQLQGIVWIRNKEASRLVTTRMGHPKMVSVFEQAIDAGKTVLVENMGEMIDAVLSPVIGRNTIKRGGKNRFIKLGDKEISYSPNFKLYLHTILSNPHYPPEVHAECTIINFTVTEQGLEEQLLFLVVKLERPDLARQKSDLISSQNEFKVKLAELEALLLEKLANAQGDILEDTDLILSLEDAKRTSEEVKAKVVIAQETEMKINKTSEYYRPCADRGSLLFFFLMDLQKIHSFYKYSLDSFVGVVTRAILSLSGKRPGSSRKSSVSYASGAIPVSPTGSSSGLRRSKNPSSKDDASSVGDDASSVGGDLDDGTSNAAGSVTDLSVRDLEVRVDSLRKIITKFVFSFTARGLFDQHKLTAATMLCLRVLVRAGTIAAPEVDLLVKGSLHPSPPPLPEPLKAWLTDTHWSQLKQLEATVPAAFKSLTGSVEQDSLSWKRWLAEERLESSDLPRQFRDLSPFYKLMLIRIFRPDRLSAALTMFVSSKLGPEFVEKSPFDMDKAYSESSSGSPIFFVLFPGVDPTPVVESMAKRLGITEGKFVNISMGQGQEQIALNALTTAAQEGGWVMLQNIHLMQSWLKQLERTLELIEPTAHPEFRCILSSEPPPASMPLTELVPESILQKSVKIADEAPEDIKSNLRRAWLKFSQTTIDQSAKQKEFKACLFGLCFFHSLVIGRKRFGPQGWSRVYPFNDGDLTICASVLSNYLAKYESVPWPDIRYIFGEIMYGGHVTDQWDRRINNTYLEVLIVPELMANMNLAPGFKSPDSSKMDYATYLKFIEDRLPAETPQMFGLHPNAEIRFLTNQGTALFETIQTVSGGAASGGGGTESSFARVQSLMTTYLNQLPKNFDMLAIRGRITDWNPYIIVALQECERMNMLLSEIKRSLIELEMGLSGALNISDQMEELIAALTLNKVFSSWEKLAYFSLKPLSSWLVDLGLRAAQLVEWTSTLTTPKSLWISGLFNPMSYLTAVMQVTARQFDLPLDCMTNRCVFTNIKDPKLELTASSPPPPKGGVYVHGLFMEGASWEDGKGDEEGYIADSKLKVLHPPMPAMNVYAIPNKDMSWEHMYHCPVYVTSQRGPTYLFTANVRMEPDDNENRWILAGAALVLTDD